VGHAVILHNAVCICILPAVYFYMIFMPTYLGPARWWNVLFSMYIGLFSITPSYVNDLLHIRDVT